MSENYKVQPEESTPAFKKPIKLKTPLTAWDATYLKRKADVGEKFFTCKSGRQFCYFTDGAADPSQVGVAVVLCLHGANQDKNSWIMQEPFTKIFQIVVDRFGAGKSSSTPVEGYSFGDGCKELLELVDGVYADRGISPEKKFFVAGHSMGGTWTIEMAACPGVCDRIEAIAPISAPCPLHHPNMTKEELKKTTPTAPGFMRGLKKKGCCGACNRCLFFQMFDKIACPHNTGRTGDYGMAATYDMLKANTGGDERARNAMDADPFFVTANMDSYRGFHTPQDSFNEYSRAYGEAWSYDIADVKVPCFIYNGEAELVVLVMAEFHHRLIKGSELIVWPGHSHLSIGIEFKRILEALVNKQKVEGGPCFST
jgi:pimeloyl-ACP methyl ester carboxylesterase